LTGLSGGPSARAIWGPVAALWDAGGGVMPALTLSAFLLGAALMWRALTLLRPGGALPRARAAVAARQPGAGPVPPLVLDLALAPLRAELGAGRGLVRGVVSVAPLLGLLGTVMGMIETFDSLADAALVTQDGGVAGGIAEALLTTQLGLVISVPGVLIGRALDRRQERDELALDELARGLAAGGAR
jgi:biopolymer transport protein ExbB